MRVGIAIDRWKLPIFNKHLVASGYRYSTGVGVTDDTMNLYVVIDAVHKDSLTKVIVEANAEAAVTKPNLN